MGWAPSQEAVGAVVANQFPRVVRLTTTDGGNHELTQVKVIGDSLHGVPVRLYAPDSVFSLHDIRRIDVKELAKGRTLLVTATVAVVGLVAFGLFAIVAGAHQIPKGSII